jgi:hypothetical protein
MSITQRARGGKLPSPNRGGKFPSPERSGLPMLAGGGKIQVSTV